MLTTAQATWRFLTSSNRLRTLQRAADSWRFLNSDLLPEAYLAEVFPESRGVRLTMDTDIRHPFELPYGERMVLATIVHCVRPRTVFEFGTYSGSTTSILADACPEGAIVHTLDLPDDELIAHGVAPDLIGARLIDRGPDQTRIVQHRVNSRRFDYAPFAGSVDLVYVDGSHLFDDVIHDSRAGFEMLTQGGVIIWDDYQLSCMPVAEALDVIGQTVPLARIAHTRLVVGRRPAGEPRAEAASPSR